MAMLKYSRQRESIKQFLQSRHDHPTADMVYAGLKQTYPNISLGTVYRNLSLLADIGEISKISAGNGPDRFDGRITPHNHFICRECHQVLDLEMDSIDHITDVAGKHFDGIVEGHITNFYGLCGDCAKNTNTSKK